MPLLSVIICTHNPRPDYFGRVLTGLRRQTLAAENWELLVVDNASRDKLAGRIDLSWKRGARLVREEKLGLTPARLTGIGEAQGELFVFVDDDNVLDNDYLETALRIAQEKPYLGSWSGQCRPSFESPPAGWTRRYWGNLVIREFENDRWSNLPRLAETMPCGAGLCVRRAVGCRYLDLHASGKRSLQLDRTGTSLISGGDNDLAACACDLGMGVGLMAALKLQHLIAPERLTEDYLVRLAEGIAFSSVLLDRERGLVIPQRGAWGRAADFARLCRLSGPHRAILMAAYRGRDRAIRQLEGKT